MADIKQKVIDFFKLPSSDKRAIKILSINYAIICAMQTPPSIQTLSPLQSQSNVTSSSSAAAIAKIDPESLSRAGINPQDENMTSASPPSK